MLFRSRKKEEDALRREAEGESLWTSQFTPQCRNKILYAVADAIQYDKYRRYALECAQTILCRDLGEISLANRGDKEQDLIQYLGGCPDDAVPDVIEALCMGVMKAQTDTDSGYHFVEPQRFLDRINEILRQERISFELIRGQMVEFGSRELHETIVAPMITLLSGKPGWAGVEKSYRSALEEIDTDPGDAITDATTALQQALVLRHCDGNALGELARSGAARHILTPYDAKIIDWANADRASKGDAHTLSTATRDDAWLAAHVIGALILRLAAEDNR